MNLFLYFSKFLFIFNYLKIKFFFFSSVKVVLDQNHVVHHNKFNINECIYSTCSSTSTSSFTTTSNSNTAQSQQTQPIIPATHPQNAAALYQQYYQAPFANMPQFINATPQQMTVGVMGAPMITNTTINWNWTKYK